MNKKIPALLMLMLFALSFVSAARFDDAYRQQHLNSSLNVTTPGGQIIRNEIAASNVNDVFKRISEDRMIELQKVQDKKYYEGVNASSIIIGKKPARFLGFIPVGLEKEYTIAKDGNVTVSKNKWYYVLFAGARE